MKNSRYEEILLGRFPNKTVIKYNGQKVEVVGIRYEDLSQKGIIKPTVLSVKDKKTGKYLVVNYSELSVSKELVPIPFLVLRNFSIVFVEDNYSDNYLQKKVILSNSAVIHEFKYSDPIFKGEKTYTEYFLSDQFEIKPDKDNHIYIYGEKKIILR